MRKREEKSRRIRNKCKLDGSGCSIGKYTWLNKFKPRKFFFTEFTVLLMSSASLGSIRCNNSSVGLKDF